MSFKKRLILSIFSPVISLLIIAVPIFLLMTLSNEFHLMSEGLLALSKILLIIIVVGALIAFPFIAFIAVPLILVFEKIRPSKAFCFLIYIIVGALSPYLIINLVLGIASGSLFWGGFGLLIFISSFVGFLSAILTSSFMLRKRPDW